MSKAQERKREAISHELRTVGVELAEATRKTKHLYEHRDRLLVQGRELDPPMTQPELGRIAGMEEGAVAQVLRKHRLQSNGATR